MHKNLRDPDRRLGMWVAQLIHDWADLHEENQRLERELQQLQHEIATRSDDSIDVSPTEMLLAEVRAEICRARAKHPNPAGAMATLTEDTGRLARALLDQPTEYVRQVAAQVAAAAIRIGLEGDPSVDEHRAACGAGMHGADARRVA